MLIKYCKENKNYYKEIYVGKYMCNDLFVLRDGELHVFTNT